MSTTEHPFARDRLEAVAGEGVFRGTHRSSSTTPGRRRDLTAGTGFSERVPSSVSTCKTSFIHIIYVLSTILHFFTTFISFSRQFSRARRRWYFSDNSTGYASYCLSLGKLPRNCTATRPEPPSPRSLRSLDFRARVESTDYRRTLTIASLPIYKTGSVERPP